MRKILFLFIMLTSLLSQSVVYGSVIDITEETDITSETDLTSDGIIVNSDGNDKKWRHKETMIAERVHAEIGDAWLTGNKQIYYVCYEGVTDYVLTEYNGTLYVFYVRVTPSAEYFLSPIELNSSTEAKFRNMMTPDALLSTEEFWMNVPVKTPEQEVQVQIRPVDANGVMMVPYFNQGAGYYLNGEWTCTDWPDVTFNANGHTMHEAGCGFFSTAMALSYLKGQIISPIEFKENGQYLPGDGSNVTVGVATAESYGVHAYFTSDINEVIEALRNGHPVMEHVGESVFTSGGHYILLVGYTNDGRFAVNDPGHVDNTYFYNGVTFDQTTIMNAAKYIETAYTIFE